VGTPHDGEVVRGPRVAHGLVPLTGRDPQERERAGSPLELIFDLVAVVAVSIAASNLEHLLAEGHWLQGLGTFAFATFGITWAWLSYSQLLSAFDSDDWGVRLVTLMQMAGVLVLALGIAPMVASVDAGGPLGNQVMVLGYVFMRVGSIILWLRVARASAEYRATALAYVRALVISQIGWILQAFLPLPPAVSFALMGVWLLQEVAYPLVAERRGRIPWHPLHMGERLSAFVIITLGEVVLGTFTAVQAELTEPGRWADAAAVGAAGLSLAFGLWWIYFITPVGEVFQVRRGALHGVGLLHMVLYGSIAAIGAGLHLAATYVAGEEGLGAGAVVLAVAIPSTLAVVMVFVCFTVLIPDFDPFHLLLLVLTIALGVLSVALAAAGVPLAVCLLVVMLLPWVSVVGWELKGHRDMEPKLQRTLAALRLRG
jgi:low temperature requirement protein LtrA